MKHLNLKIIRIEDFSVDTKGSIICEICFKELKYKTKPAKAKLLWDANNIFELGEYRSADIISVSIVSRKTEIFGGCVINLKEYKKCGIFEKTFAIYEFKPGKGEINGFLDNSNLNSKSVIGNIYVEVIVYSPIALNRTQSDRKLDFNNVRMDSKLDNILNRFRSKERSEKSNLKIESTQSSADLSIANKSKSDNNNNNNDNSNNNNQNGKENVGGVFRESFSAITFVEIEKSDKRERDRRRRKKKKLEEEGDKQDDKEKKREKRNRSREREENKIEKKKSDRSSEVITGEKQEKRVRRREKPAVIPTTPDDHNRKISRVQSLTHAKGSKSAPVIRRRTSKSKRDENGVADNNNNNNGERERRKKKEDAKIEIPEANGNTKLNENNRNSNSDSHSLIAPNSPEDVTVVTLTPLAVSGDLAPKLFGVALDEVMSRQKPTHPDLDVPRFFIIAADIIRANRSSGNLKGIFRIRGKLTEVKELRKKIDNGADFEEDASKNVHTLSTLMKAFLRELPVPLLTFENYDKYIKCADISDMSEQAVILKDIVDSIPYYNYMLLKFVMGLMYELSLFPEETQMNSENLAKIISPNLIWKEIVNIEDMTLVDDALKGNKLANTMIVHFKEIFTR